LKPSARPLPRLPRALLLAGPGIFCVGYTIGTGAVTKLAAAGAQAGLQLLWVVPLSCLLFWALMEAYGRLAVVTGGTALHGFRTQLRAGRWLALFILAGVVTGQWTGLPVLVSQVSQLIYDGLRLMIPSAPVQHQGAVIGIAIVMLGGVYALLLVGRYSFLEKVLVVVVALMVGGFLGVLWMTRPALEMFAHGLIPSMPAVDGGALIVTVLIGTTMAAPTFLVRSLLLKGKGWGGANIRDQRRDSIISAAIIFILGATIMACAAGALYQRDLSIRIIFDVVQGLEPAAGRMAAGLFLLGALGAGLSSIIPMVMILPLLIADYRTGELQIRTPLFRALTALACAVGLAGPIIGDQLLPIHRAASQVAQVFVLPLVVGGVFLLLNRDELMGGHKAGFWLNAGLLAAFGFSLVVSWLGLTALGRRFA
jgi:Mn2+/Fe2+ NRAMP family transporter